MLKPPERSFFLFGPRGTGKTWWTKRQFPKAIFVDLLDFATYAELASQPQRLADRIPEGFDDWIVVDEVQKVPALLNEVHRLIESKRYKFVLTGSSARTLRRKGVNLLAGRAVLRHMHPLTAAELGSDFDLNRSLGWGQLPMACSEADPKDYLESYSGTYLREEVQQEGLTRDLGAFSRFLEIASLGQGQLLNVSEISREAMVGRKAAEGYFSLSEDLLLSHRVPVFSKRAKRKLISHCKFYFFDVGVFRTLRPSGPGDLPAETDGAALETLVFQELRASNDNLGLDYQLFFWRTRGGLEVDFILYGPRGFHAIEVKRTKSVSPKDLRGLREFGRDYPEATLTLFYGGAEPRFFGNVTCLPLGQGLKELPTLIGG